MNNKMEPVTPVVVIQGAMVFLRCWPGFAFGLFTGQAHVAGLSMAWMALCGWFSRLRRSSASGCWLACSGCVAYSAGGDKSESGVRGDGQIPLGFGDLLPASSCSACSSSKSLSGCATTISGRSERTAGVSGQTTKGKHQQNRTSNEL